ncbi:MAG: hypothetical protein JXQ71_09255 [Verrucomicrobia bacterium]|nr:hypothetical protein [Verrucomicrobiota bacterium]
MAQLPAGWLERQMVFCLTSPCGPIDIFRVVRGLPDGHAAAQRAFRSQTAAGVHYRGLSDEDMLACQLALDEHERKPERIRFLSDLLKRNGHQ